MSGRFESQEHHAPQENSFVERMVHDIKDLFMPHNAADLLKNNEPKADSAQAHLPNCDFFEPAMASYNQQSLQIPMSQADRDATDMSLVGARQEKEAKGTHDFLIMEKSY